jgi:signal transduction histidine kinase
VNIRISTLRKRIMVIILIAILLPCSVLVYFSFYSLQIEKERLQDFQQEQIGQILSREAEQLDYRINDYLRLMFSSIPLFREGITTTDISHIRNIKNRFDIIEGIILFDTDLSLVYPAIFQSERQLAPENLLSGKIDRDPHYILGKELELKGQYAEAVERYKEGLMSASDKETKILFLMCIARCEYKIGEITHARDSYKRILTELDGQLLGYEIPFELIAYTQIVITTELLGVVNEIGTSVLDFYEYLISNFYRFEYDQFRYFLTLIQKKISDYQIQSLEHASERLKRLQLLEEEIRNEIKLRNVVLSKVMPLIPAVYRTVTQRRSTHFEHILIDGERWIIALQTLNEESHGYLSGVFIRPEKLFELASNILEQDPWEKKDLALVSGQKNNVNVTGSEEDVTVLSASLPYFSYAMGNPYSLVVLSIESDLFAPVFETRMYLYYIILFLILSLLMLGIMVLVRDVYREAELAKLKSHFISNVTHEIKTPISTIHALTENLVNGLIPDQSKQQRYFHLIQRNSERLNHLVSNFLDFSRIEAKKKIYQKELLPVRDVIKKSAARFKTLLNVGTVQFSASISPNLPSMMVDAGGLELAILNLLDNAVKYSGSSPTVELSAERSNNHVIIRVRDYGIGIKYKDHKKIFDKHYRAETTDGKNIPGSGIGLAIVKDVVSAHGGRVEVDSEVDKGTTITMYLPVVTN